MNAQRARLLDGHEFLPLLEKLQLLVVGDAGQPQAIDFLVLPQQRLVRSAQQRIPDQVPVMSAMPGVVMLIMVQSKRLATRQHQHTQQKRRSTRTRPKQERPPDSLTRR